MPSSTSLTKKGASVFQSAVILVITAFSLMMAWTEHCNIVPQCTTVISCTRVTLYCRDLTVL